MTKKKPPVAPKLPTITAFDQLTPAAAVELYKKHGLKPKSRVLQPSSKGCCIMGVVMVEMGQAVDENFDNDMYDAFEKLFPSGPRIMFEMGFDHALDFVTQVGEPTEECANTSAMYRQGWDVGLACGRAAKAEQI